MKINIKLLILSVCSATLLFFQNCSPGFKTNVSATGESSLSSSQNAFKCVANSQPSPASAKRLSKLELQRTYALHLAGYSASEQAAIKTAIAPFMQSIPDDNGEKFDTDDVALAQDHVAAYFSAAKAFATEVTKTLARTKTFMGACATTTPLTDPCLDSFLSAQATKILRRPLTAPEVTAIKAEYAGYSEKNNQWLLTRLYMSPSFIFHLELDGQNESPTLLKISPYELASRISFYLLKMAPDDALLAAAAGGTLVEKDKITSEIARLAAQYPTYYKATVDEFFAGWLAYKNIAYPLTPVELSEVAFAAGRKLSRQSLINEMQGMVRHYTNDAQGSFDDLFLTTKSFAVDDDLAAIYGVSKWTGSKNALVDLPANERTGLLSRAAFMVSGDANTSPIIRGLMLRRQFLCDEIPQPPDDIANMVRDPLPDPNASTRKRFEDKTSSAACTGCHALINPLGFAMENFDAFGRYRTSEKLFDDAGNMVNQIKIDPVVKPYLSFNDGRTIASAAEFSQAMAETGRARNCMARSFFKFAYRESPDPINDGCALVQIDQQVQGVGGLNNMFLNAPLAEAFQKRKLD